jgi:Ulp1 family protease
MPIEEQLKWTLEHPMNTPKQQNNYDCGIFCLMMADFLLEDLPLTFSQLNVADFRYKICWSICNNLLPYTGSSVLNKKFAI